MTSRAPFADYLESGVLTISRSRRPDAFGVRLAGEDVAKSGRQDPPDIHIGVCGEHGGDPESIHFFHKGPGLRLVQPLPGARGAPRSRPRCRRPGDHLPTASDPRPLESVQ